MKENRHGFGKEKIFSLIVSLGILLVLGYGIYSVVTGVQNSEKNNIVNLNDSENDNVAMRTEDVTDADDSDTDKLEQANAEAEKHAGKTNIQSDDAQYENEAAADQKALNKNDAGDGSAVDGTNGLAGQQAGVEDAEAANTDAVSANNSLKAADIDTKIANAAAAYTFDESSVLAWPVAGEELLKYSMDTTIYFPSLGVYKCNPAILIGAPAGTNIGVAADGIVQSVVVNEETGNTIAVAVGGGYVTTYGLVDGAVVKKGDTVTKGQLLGKVAGPTAYYSKEGPGLYFKVTKDEEPVDPGMFLGE